MTTNSKLRKNTIISQRQLRIHLGSGIYHWPSYINWDAYGSPDMLGDLKKLSYEDESVDEIHAIHLFEHLPRIEIGTFLAEWKRVLKPDGVLVLEMPSLDKIAKLITEGVTDARITTLGIYGDPRDPKPGMMHQWGYTQWELGEILKQCGFTYEFKEPTFHMAIRDLRVECRRK